MMNNKTMKSGCTNKIRKHLILSLYIALAILNPLSINAGKITDYVNPFIGTGVIENSLSG
ncbi:MAG: hypothetical protein LBV74_10215 [Tannerella sp.]|nr:hypothetical protein [Tannerella sp.]